MTNTTNLLNHGDRRIEKKEDSILENAMGKKPVMIGHCSHCVNEEICKYKEEAMEVEKKVAEYQKDSTTPYRVEMKCRLFRNNTFQEEILKKKRDFIGEY